MRGGVAETYQAGDYSFTFGRRLPLKRLRYFLASFMLIPLLGLSNGLSYADTEWAIDATISGSCSCNAICPCTVGSPPTNDFSQGSNLIEIGSGHHSGINLDGLVMVATRSGGEWLKIFINETASDAQMNALVELLKLDETMGLAANTEIISKEKVKISIERTPNRVKFSVPSSTVEIEMMEGLDGKPIKVDNLPRPFLADYTQYKSTNNIHLSNEHKFSHSGTQGSVSRLKAFSRTEKE